MSSSNVTYNFTGRTALVTGAGRGIGRAVAVALVASGAETYALSKNKSNLDALVAECPSIQPVCVDLSDWEATRKMIESLPVIDLLVNNAGIAPMNNFLDAKPEDFDKSFAVNVKAILNVSQVVAKKLISNKCSGSIVNVSSKTSKRYLKDLALYSTTKAAVDRLTEVMAHDLGPYNIRVNSVNPTVVMTDMGHTLWGDPKKSDPVKARIPLGRFVEVDEVVGPVLNLLSDSAIMIHGQTIVIDGGYTVS